MLASDDANREFVNPKNPDRALRVTFYSRTEPHNFHIRLNRDHALCEGDTECVHVKDEKGPLKDAYGRPRKFPLVESVTEDWINISMPGRPDLDVHEPARDDHKKRFPVEWEEYQGQMVESGQSGGTKLADWGELSPHAVAMMQAQRFYTVEQVASCSDGQLQALGMNANLLRQKARAFILQGRENSEAAKHKAEADAKAKELQELRESIPALVAAAAAEAVKQAMAMQQLPAAEPPKRKGRPPKPKATDGAESAPAS